ncbi:MAG TPA: TetR/AcrR family transcriptional regulator [Thermomicrobiales bacterium]|nr:TetR/AcrR family transcriptional regulator [Thermomicrobiales bacterium]
MVDAQKVKRRTADERREEVIQAAIVEFATYGFHGGSTERIADAAGISQPYVLRLFGTKKALFLAALDQVSTDIIDAWSQALARHPGGTSDERLDVLRETYRVFVEDVVQLRLVLQGFSSSEDREVRVQSQECLGRMFAWTREATGADAEQVRLLFAQGMTLMVAASIRAWERAGSEEWARAMLMMPLDEVPTLRQGVRVNHS